jgi:hypothetical protein
MGNGISSAPRTITRRLSVLKERFDATLARRRALNRIASLKNWERKFGLNLSLLRERRALADSQATQELAPLRKRIRKSQRRLRRTLPQSERSLSQAIDNKAYITDLRKRLVDAKERCLASKHGLKPSEDVEEGLRALEDGNPFSTEYAELSASVGEIVAAHKAKELAWLDASIKKATGWLKTLDRLSRKMVACVEIGAEVANQIDKVRNEHQ